MRMIDQSGLLLCDLQARAFELAGGVLSCSSEIFMRRFMNSEVAAELDCEYALNAVMTPKEILARVEEQYGATDYGKVKYSGNEAFWIGYLYRYFCYTYQLTSSQVYRMVKPKELREMYPACHTMDCAQAIERIMEAKGINLTCSLEKQYSVFRRIRKCVPAGDV